MAGYQKRRETGAAAILMDRRPEPAASVGRATVLPFGVKIRAGRV